MSAANGNGPAQPVQPDPAYVIAALTEENQAANANRIYLMSLLRQMQAEFTESVAAWEADRASLKARIEELTETSA